MWIYFIYFSWGQWKFACYLLTCWYVLGVRMRDWESAVRSMCFWDWNSSVCAHSIRILSMRVSFMLCSMNLKRTNWPVWSPHTHTHKGTDRHHRSTACDLIDPKIFTYEPAKKTHTHNNNKCAHVRIEWNGKKWIPSYVCLRDGSGKDIQTYVFLRR